MYYHISFKDLGKTTVFQPKIPSSSVISSEGNIPRICVTTSVVNCIKSIVSHNGVSVMEFLFEIFFRDALYDGSSAVDDWIKNKSKLTSPVIYRCKETPYLPPDASDFRRNREHWYLSPTEFIRSGYIDLNRLVETGKVYTISKLNTLDGSYLKQKSLLNIQIRR